MTNLWQGHSPSPFDWQVLLLRANGWQHLVQFPRSRYERRAIIRRANEEADFMFAHAFVIRDDTGEVVHHGAVLNALGQPATPLDAEVALARFEMGEDKWDALQKEWLA